MCCPLMAGRDPRQARLRRPVGHCVLQLKPPAGCQAQRRILHRVSGQLRMGAHLRGASAVRGGSSGIHLSTKALSPLASGTAISLGSACTKLQFSSSLTALHGHTWHGGKPVKEQQNPGQTRVREQCSGMPKASKKFPLPSGRGDRLAMP